MTAFPWNARLTLVLFFFLIVVGTTNLQYTPLMDWDEGWTLTVARNWVERGFYGRLLGGKLAPPGLEASFPVTGSVALAMRVLGVGVWQGRIAAVVTMLGALALLFFLTRWLYDSATAVVTLGILCFLIPHPRMNALVMDRQVFAEPLMLLSIVGGFISLLLARERHRAWIILSMVFWGTAFMSKAQVLPFLLLSLLAAISINLWNSRRDQAVWLIIAVLGALLSWRVWLLTKTWVLEGHTLPATVLPDVYSVMAFVPSWSERITAFILTWLVGTPIILGLIYFTYSRSRHRGLLSSSDSVDDVRVALWVLATAWLLWYVFLSNAGIARYLATPLFFGSIFASVLLRELTNGFNLSATGQQIVSSIHKKRLDGGGAKAWLALVIILFYVPLTLQQLAISFFSEEGRATLQVADFLNRTVPASSLVETYDSELFVLLDRSYHYPPDQVHLALNRRMEQLPAALDYEPLQPGPDYLVVGPTSRIWKLYDPVLGTGVFRSLETLGPYSIYVRADLDP